MLAFALAATAAIVGVQVPDKDLATMRGGFDIPGGLGIVIAVQTDTRSDGVLILRSVYRIDQGAPTLTVYAPDPSGALGDTGKSPAIGTSAPGVSITFDRQNGTRVSTDIVATPRISVSSTSATGTSNSDDAGSSPIALRVGGPAVAVAGGSLQLDGLPNGQSVKLSSSDLVVSHLVGGAIGSVIINSGNDRIIDTSTTLGIDISGATAANLGSSMLRIDTLVGDATAALLPR